MKKSKGEHHRRQGTKHTSQHLSTKQEVAKKSSSLYWGRHDEAAGEDLSISIGDETDCLCSGCRGTKIDNHLVTLQKALRYKNQLDEIITTTKKREKELKIQLKTVDQLSFKLRHDQLLLQHEENAMAERLQALKEKEIFVNCQMVKLQSLEHAIKHRRRELNKEKLRIEKLAYLIFKTDLSTMTYKEFHNRISKMQNQLERKYRKIKVFEHYCKHKTLPRGMTLEPITPIDFPIEQTLDPAVSAFKEAIWGNKCSRLIDSSNTSMKSTLGFNYKRYLNKKDENEDPPSEKYHRKVPKENESMVKTSFKTKAMAKDGHCLSFFQSQQSSFTTTVYETDSNLTRVTGQDINSGVGGSNSNCDGSNNSKQSTQVSSLTVTKKSKSEQEGQNVKDMSNNGQRWVMSAKETYASSHRLLQTPVPCDSGKNDEDKENQEPISPNQTSHHENDDEKMDGSASQSSRSQKDGDFIQEDEEEEFDDDHQENELDQEDSASDSFLSDIPEEIQEQSTNSEELQDIVDETEIIHRRISQLETSDYHDLKVSDDLTETGSSSNNFDETNKIINWCSLSKDTDLLDENDREICSIFRNSKNAEEKISSQSLIHPESTKCIIIPWKKHHHHSNNNNSDESIRDEGSGNDLCKHVHGKKRNLLRTPSPSRRTNRDQHGNRSHNRGQNRTIHRPILTGDQSSDKSADESIHCHDQYHDNSLVKDRLSQLSETTRNEIVYAIGQKALAQVAQAIDKVSKSRMENEPSKHGDQILRLLINETNNNKIMHDDICQQEPHQILRTSSGRSPDPYLQMIRRGPTPVRKGPRKIPSHLKFGNFNIRHRNRRGNTNTYRALPQPPSTFHGTELQQEPSLVLENQQSTSKINKPVLNSNDSNGDDPSQDPNYNLKVGIVTEKILGIHTVSNPNRRRDEVAPKLSHTRAFRV